MESLEAAFSIWWDNLGTMKDYLNEYTARTIFKAGYAAALRNQSAPAVPQPKYEQPIAKPTFNLP